MFQFILAIHIDHFTPLAEFKTKVDRAIEQAKAARKAEGFEEVLMPGERGYRAEERQRREGIAIFDEVWERTTAMLHERLGLDADSVVNS